MTAGLTPLKPHHIACSPDTDENVHLVGLILQGSEDEEREVEGMMGNGQQKPVEDVRLTGDGDMRMNLAQSVLNRREKRQRQARSHPLSTFSQSSLSTAVDTHPPTAFGGAAIVEMSFHAVSPALKLFYSCLV